MLPHPVDCYQFRPSNAFSYKLLHVYMFKSAVSTVPDEAVLIRPELLRTPSQLTPTSPAGHDYYHAGHNYYHVDRNVPYGNSEINDYIVFALFVLSERYQFACWCSV